MTFLDPEADKGVYETNPYTQDIGKVSDKKKFEQSPMMKIDHEDPGLHYIGEGLPKPGETEATWSGQSTHVGYSPIPARADHTHDTYLRYTVCYSAGAPTYCFAGQTLIQHTWLSGERYYNGGAYSGSLLILPQKGIWFINATIAVNIDDGGYIQGQANIVFFYTNGTGQRIVFRDLVQDIPNGYAVNVTDFVHYGQPNIGVNNTFEMAYQHNDTERYHIITVQQLTVTRLADYDL